MDMQKWLQLASEVESELSEKGIFKRVDDIAFKNQVKVMDAFRELQVSESHFCPTSGYGYDDRGRDTLDEVVARVFEAEDAFCRHTIISGTQALCIGLFGILRMGDTMLSVTGKPYDTLEEVIGIRGEGNGSLRDYGINYRQIDMTESGIDFPAIKEALESDPSIKMVFVQRSKGYSIRPTLSAKEIGDIASFAHNIRPDVYVTVDNCYGEFCDEHDIENTWALAHLVSENTDLFIGG